LRLLLDAGLALVAQGFRLASLARFQVRRSAPQTSDLLKASCELAEIQSSSNSPPSFAKHARRQQRMVEHWSTASHFKA
jgi:hypothetical protein